MARGVWAVMGVPPGFKIRNTYRLKPEEVAKMEELRSIRRSAEERLASLMQKVTDCKRLSEGLMTEVKWREGWQEGDIVMYDPLEQVFLSCEAK